jgi:hypothetical protein
MLKFVSHKSHRAHVTEYDTVHYVWLKVHFMFLTKSHILSLHTKSREKRFYTVLPSSSNTVTTVKCCHIVQRNIKIQPSQLSLDISGIYKAGTKLNDIKFWEYHWKGYEWNIWKRNILVKDPCDTITMLKAVHQKTWEYAWSSLNFDAVEFSTSFAYDLNNTGLHQYWIQTPVDSTAKDFIQQKVNKARSTQRESGMWSSVCSFLWNAGTNLSNSVAT